MVAEAGGVGVSVSVGLTVEVGLTVKTAVVAAIPVAGICVRVEAGLASAAGVGFMRAWYTIARIKPMDRQVTSAQTMMTSAGSSRVVMDFWDMFSVSAVKR